MGIFNNIELDTKYEEEKQKLQDLRDRSVSVWKHKGFDIYTLKEAIPANGDTLDFFTITCFGVKYYSHVEDAIKDIDEN